MYSKVEGSSPPTLPSLHSKLTEEEVILCNINKLSWNLYRKVRK